MPLVQSQPDALARTYAASLFSLAQEQCGQARIEETLAELEDAGRAAEVKSPALVIVGEVAALAEQLHWFGSRPLAWRQSRAAA